MRRNPWKKMLSRFYRQNKSYFKAVAADLEKLINKDAVKKFDDFLFKKNRGNK